VVNLADGEDATRAAAARSGASADATNSVRAPVRWRRRLAWIAAVVLVLASVGYVGASAVVYDRLSNTTAGCPGDRSDPTSFTFKDLDTRPYWLPKPIDEHFPARSDPKITISAWWIPSPRGLDAPTVILVHGFNGCKANAPNELAAGMLHKHGIAVLLIDLRNHGDSTVPDGRFAGGNKEYRDVLGAWDWLRAQGVPERRIGFLGFSLGAATTMIAFGQEPRVAAIWEDSSYADVGEAIRDELSRNGYPTILEAGGRLVGKVWIGDDIEGHSPLETTAELNGRPLFITHGLLDKRLSVKFAFELAQGAALHGQIAGLWIVPDAGHTEAIWRHPAEYEQRLTDFFLGVLGG